MGRLRGLNFGGILLLPEITLAVISPHSLSRCAAQSQSWQRLDASLHVHCILLEIDSHFGHRELYAMKFGDKLGNVSFSSKAVGQLGNFSR